MKNSLQSLAKLAFSLHRRLHERSELVPEAGCRLWTGAVDDWGYGIICCGNKVYKTHRAVWILEREFIPEGILVLHRCDIPCCINIHHLFLGTNADNSDDKFRKGRAADVRGTKNPRAKLTDEQVISIRSDSRPRKIIAAEHGISLALIQKIKHLDIWTHL